MSEAENIHAEVPTPETPREILTNTTGRKAAEVQRAQIDLLLELADKLDAVVDGLKTVGHQQQWVTDTIAELKAGIDPIMESVLKSGNPIKALMSGLFGGK